MTQKPVLIYFIAIWAFIQKAFYINVPASIISKLLGFDGPVPMHIRTTLSVITIVLLVGLVQLRPIARYIVIMLLVMASLIIAKIYAGIIFTGYSPVTGAPFPTRTYVSFAVMLLINCLCIVYLYRPNFGNLCRTYRNEVEARKKDILRDKELQRALKQKL